MLKFLSWILLIGIFVFVAGYVVNRFVESTVELNRFAVAY